MRRQSPGGVLVNLLAPRMVGALAVTGVLLTTGCGDAPVAPTPPVASSPETYLQGRVVDTLWRPVPSALVEIVTGPATGMRRTTDEKGIFLLAARSPAGTALTLRVSKDGFETTTSNAVWQSTPTNGVVVPELHQLDPPLGLHGGDYRLTVSIDLTTADGVGCSGFPPELASRTYDAAVAEGPRRGERRLSINGPTMRPSWNFWNTYKMFVAGDVASMASDDGAIAEEFPGYRYLEIEAGFVPTQFTVSSDRVQLPAWVAFTHCELSSAADRGHSCFSVPPDRIVRRHSCASNRGLLTFTRR